MAVSKKKTAAPADESAKQPVKEGKELRFSVMLGNDCQRYMTPKNELFLALKRYSVTGAKRKELFSYYDENGIRFFYDTEVIQKQIEAAKRRGKRYTEEEEGEEQEIDIAKGVTTLRDEEGEDVGKKGDTVSI
jgi:hypothetical protein